MYECNTEACSRYCCCHGRAISITYSECASVALVIQHAMHMPYILLSSVACLALPHMPISCHKEQDFQKKKVIEHKLCVLIFSRTFLILGRIQRHTAINVQTSLRKVPVIHLKM